jgi:PST family polysaccharide transporter
MSFAVRVTKRLETSFNALRTSGSAGLMRGAMWMTLSEVGNRVSRIVTAVVLARVMTTLDFAAMALVLTTYELVRMLIHNGVGARIVGARQDELDEICVAVNRINWIVGATMCVLQILIAWPMQSFYHSDVALVLAALAVVHVIYPLGMTHGCLAQRREQLGFVAGMQFFQITGDNLGTAALAFIGCGVWAVVVPKLVIALIWVLVHLRFVPGWRRVTLHKTVFWSVVRYSRAVFGAEALNTVRCQGDRLIVGKVLGMEAFGIYSFGANAGSGIATGLATALGQVALPYLSKDQDGGANLRSRFWRTITTMSLIVVPIVVLQVTLAPIYVPWVFGAKWIPATPTLMLMCLATIARPIAVATSQLLRATGAVSLELRMSQWNVGVFFLALLVGLPFGVEGVATTLLAANVVPTLYFASVALSRVAPSRRALDQLVAEVA